MRKSIYLKLIFGYVIFGLFSYMLIATYVPGMLHNYFVRENSSAIYEEAVLIADTYASKLYTNEISLDTVKTQIDALSVFWDADIWILNPSGRMVLSSAQEIILDEIIMVNNFDPSSFAGSYYTIGNFFGFFDRTHTKNSSHINNADAPNFNKMTNAFGSCPYQRLV